MLMTQVPVLWLLLPLPSRHLLSFVFGFSMLSGRSLDRLEGIRRHLIAQTEVERFQLQVPSNVEFFHNSAKPFADWIYWELDRRCQLVQSPADTDLVVSKIKDQVRIFQCSKFNQNLLQWQQFGKTVYWCILAWRILSFSSNYNETFLYLTQVLKGFLRWVVLLLQLYLTFLIDSSF